MITGMQSTCLSVLTTDDDEVKQLTDADQLTIEDEDHVTTEEDTANTDAILPLDHENEVRIERDNRVMHKFLMANHGDICLYLCILLLLVSSLIALVIVVLQIVLPYKRAQTFHNTSCTTSRVSIKPGSTCTCGVGCTASYRCLVITVTYLDQLAMQHVNASFYENESAMGKECSFYPPCRHSPNRAEESVSQYEQQYGTVGRTFPCLYAATGLQHQKQQEQLEQHSQQQLHQQQTQQQTPIQTKEQSQERQKQLQQHRKADQVVRTRVLTVYHVVHGLLWSSGILLASLVGLLITLRKRGCHLYSEQ